MRLTMTLQPAGASERAPGSSAALSAQRSAHQPHKGDTTVRVCLCACLHAVIQNCCAMAPYYALLLCLHLKIRAQCRVNVVIGQDAIRVWSDTQVIHMHRNFQPTVRGAWREPLSSQVCRLIPIIATPG